MDLVKKLEEKRREIEEIKIKQVEIKARAKLLEEQRQKLVTELKSKNIQSFTELDQQIKELEKKIERELEKIDIPKELLDDTNSEKKLR